MSEINDILKVSPDTDKMSSEEKIISGSKGKASIVIHFILDDFSGFVISNDSFYRYNGKFYEPVEDYEVGKKIHKWYEVHNLSYYWSLQKEKEIKALLWYKDEIPHVELDKNEEYLNLNNGVLNLETLKFSNHTPKLYFSYALSVNYNPSAKNCPVFTRFLAGCFAESGTWDDGYKTDIVMIENIIRLMGYVLYPKIMITGMFICLGDGANGKGILFNLISSFFPPKYVSHLDLSTLSNSTSMNRSQLIYSKLNITTEQKGEKIDTEELKKITDGEPISLSIKYKDNISIVPRCKLLISSNDQLYFNDSSYGQNRRLYLFNFRNRFYTAEQLKTFVNPEQRRFFEGKPKEWMIEQLNLEKESILNILIEGLIRIKKDNWQFVKSENMDKLKEELTESNDPIGTWLLDNYELGIEGDEISIDLIYSDFSDYYVSNFAKRNPYSSITIGKRIRSVFRIDSMRKYMDGKQGRCFQLRKRTFSALDTISSLSGEVKIQ